MAIEAFEPRHFDIGIRYSRIHSPDVGAVAMWARRETRSIGQADELITLQGKKTLKRNATPELVLKRDRSMFARFGSLDECASRFPVVLRTRPALGQSYPSR